MEDQFPDLDALFNLVCAPVAPESNGETRTWTFRPEMCDSFLHAAQIMADRVYPAIVHFHAAATHLWPAPVSARRTSDTIMRRKIRRYKQRSVRK